MFFDGPPKSARATRGPNSWNLVIVPPKSKNGQELVFFLGEGAENSMLAQEIACAINDAIRKHSGAEKSS
jgi:hypothetical protein